jgi:hypothetical protein
MERNEAIARILAGEAGFDVCELMGKPDVCSPSSDPDFGLLANLTAFYELVRKQVIEEIEGTDDPLMR